MKKIGLLFVTLVILFFTNCGGGGSVALTISSFSKDSVHVTTGGTVTLTFTFNKAVPSTSDPTVTVTSDNDSDGTVGTPSCSFDSDREVYTCTVSGIDGCTTYSDYSVTVTHNDFSSDYTTSFNSGDDEYDGSTANITTCYDDSEGTPSIGSGKLKLEVAAGGGTTKVVKNINTSGAFAFSGRLVSNSTPSSGSNNAFVNQLLKENSGASDDRDFGIGDGYFADLSEILWLTSLGENGTQGFAVPTTSGSLGSIRNEATLYICIIRFNNTAKMFVSADGSTYSEVTTSAMECDDNCSGFSLSEVINPSSMEVSQLKVDLAASSAISTVYEPEFDYLRFNTNHVDGVVSDCPPF